MNAVGFRSRHFFFYCLWLSRRRSLWLKALRYHALFAYEEEPDTEEESDKEKEPGKKQEAKSSIQESIITE